MRTDIKPNDVVLHKPSGEKWVVAGVNAEEGKLIPYGYPFPSIANMADCELLERGYEAKPQEERVIREFMNHGLLSFVDVRSALLFRLYGFCSMEVHDDD